MPPRPLKGPPLLAYQFRDSEESRSKFLTEAYLHGLIDPKENTHHLCRLSISINVSLHDIKRWEEIATLYYPKSSFSQAVLHLFFSEDIGGGEP